MPDFEEIIEYENNIKTGKKGETPSSTTSDDIDKVMESPSSVYSRPSLGDKFNVFLDVLEEDSPDLDNKSNNANPSATPAVDNIQLKKRIEQELLNILPQLMEYKRKGYNIVGFDEESVIALENLLQEPYMQPMPQKLEEAMKLIISSAQGFLHTVKPLLKKVIAQTPEDRKSQQQVNAVINNISAALSAMNAAGKVGGISWEAEVNRVTSEQMKALVKATKETLIDYKGTPVSNINALQIGNKLRGLLSPSEAYLLMEENVKFKQLKKSLLAESRITRQRLAEYLETKTTQILTGVKNTEEYAIKELLKYATSATQIFEADHNDWLGPLNDPREVDPKVNDHVGLSNSLLEVIKNKPLDNEPVHIKIARAILPVSEVLGTVSKALNEVTNHIKPAAEECIKPHQNLWDKAKEKAKNIKQVLSYQATMAGNKVEKTVSRLKFSFNWSPVIHYKDNGEAILIDDRKKLTLSPVTYANGINGAALLLLDKIQQAERRIKLLPSFACELQEAVEQHNSVAQRTPHFSFQPELCELLDKQLKQEETRWCAIIQQSRDKLQVLIAPITQLAQEKWADDFYYGLGEELRSTLKDKKNWQENAKFDEIMEETVKQFANVARELDGSAVRLVEHGRAGGKELQKKMAQWLQKLSLLKGTVKAGVVKMTGATLDNFSRGGMLARGMAEWAEDLKQSYLQETRAEDKEAAVQLFERTLLEVVDENRTCFAKEFDPQAVGFHKRLTLALKHAAENTTVYPPTPEEILAGSRSLPEDIRRWAEKKVVSGAISAAIRGGFKLVTGTFALPVRVVIRSATTGRHLYAGTRAINRGVRLGEGPATQIKNKFITQELSKAAFKLTISLSPAVAWGVAASITVERLYNDKGHYKKIIKNTAIDLPEELLWRGGYAGVNAAIKAQSEQAINQVIEDMLAERNEQENKPAASVNNTASTSTEVSLQPKARRTRDLSLVSGDHKNVISDNYGEDSVLNKVRSHLEKFETDNKLSDVERAMVIDVFLYENKNLVSDEQLNYKKSWLEFRQELKRQENKEIKEYLSFRAVIEAYDEYKSKVAGDDTTSESEVSSLTKETIEFFQRPIFPRSIYSMSALYDSMIAYQDKYDNYIRLDDEEKYGYEYEDECDFHFLMAEIYFNLIVRYADNKIINNDISNLVFLKNYNSESNELSGGIISNGVSLESVIRDLQVMQERHNKAHGIVSAVNGIYQVLLMENKTEEDIFLDNRAIAAQLYDGKVNVSLQDRGKWLDRYSQIKSEKGEDGWELIHIEVIIYNLRKNNTPDGLAKINSVPLLFLVERFINYQKEMIENILETVASPHDNFKSYSTFKTREDLDNNDNEYYSQFDDYKNNNDAAKEAKNSFAVVAGATNLSFSELFGKVEDVKIFSYIYTDGNGRVATAAPGRVMVIKLPGENAGGIIISNLFLKTNFKRLSSKEMNAIKPLTNSTISGEMVHRSMPGPYYYRGTQDEHNNALEILTNMKSEEFRLNLKNKDIWHGEPAYFSSEYPQQENVRDLKSGTLKDAILGALTIENNAASRYLRMAMYKSTGWEEIGDRFLPLYEIIRKSSVDSEYVINAEQLTLDIISIATIAYPAVRNIASTIRTSISGILKSGLRGSALYKALGRELGNLGFEVSKILGGAAYELIEPYPINSHFSLNKVSDILYNSGRKENKPVPQGNEGHPGESNTAQNHGFSIKKNNQFYSLISDVDKSSSESKLVQQGADKKESVQLTQPQASSSIKPQKSAISPEGKAQKAPNPSNESVRLAPPRTASEKGTYKFKIGQTEMLGKRNKKSIEISLDDGVTWIQGNNTHMFAFALQNAGGRPKLPGEESSSNNITIDEPNPVSKGVMEQGQKNIIPDIEEDFSRHLESNLDPDPYFIKIKDATPNEGGKSFKFFGQEINGRVQNSNFEISRDNGITWKKGWWLQEIIWRLRSRGDISSAGLTSKGTKEPANLSELYEQTKASNKNRNHISFISKTKTNTKIVTKKLNDVFHDYVTKTPIPLDENGMPIFTVSAISFGSLARKELLLVSDIDLQLIVIARDAYTDKAKDYAKTMMDNVKVEWDKVRRSISTNPKATALQLDSVGGVEGVIVVNSAEKAAELMKPKKIGSKGYSDTYADSRAIYESKPGAYQTMFEVYETNIQNMEVNSLINEALSDLGSLPSTLHSAKQTFIRPITLAVGGLYRKLHAKMDNALPYETNTLKRAKILKDNGLIDEATYQNINKVLLRAFKWEQQAGLDNFMHGQPALPQGVFSTRSMYNKSNKIKLGISSASNKFDEMHELKHAGANPISSRLPEKIEYNLDKSIPASEYLAQLKQDPRINDKIMKPAGQCESLMSPVSSFMKINGFTDIRYRGMYIWNHAMEQAPMNHFVVVGNKNGKDYVFDVSAHQFENKGMPDLNGPLILSAEDWVKKYEGATTRKLIYYSDFTSSSTAANTYNGHPTELVSESMEGKTLIKSPGWYETFKRNKNIPSLICILSRGGRVARGTIDGIPCSNVLPTEDRGTYGFWKNSQNKKNNGFHKDGTVTHEAEHTIGIDVLVNKYSYNPQKSQAAKTTGENRNGHKDIEDSAPAYQEFKNIHRGHIGTGSLGLAPNSPNGIPPMSQAPGHSGKSVKSESILKNAGDSALTYRHTQRKLVEQGNIGAAIAYNQKAYAHNELFQLIYNRSALHEVPVGVFNETKNKMKAQFNWEYKKLDFDAWFEEVNKNQKATEILNNAGINIINRNHVKIDGITYTDTNKIETRINTRLQEEIDKVNESYYEQTQLDHVYLLADPENSPLDVYRVTLNDTDRFYIIQARIAATNGGEIPTRQDFMNVIKKYDIKFGSDKRDIDLDAIDIDY